jgi:RHS repeat-associated protein
MNGSSLIARHDYLPFGEEIGSGIGFRSSTPGYGELDTNRQKYAMTRRDETTELDHTWFRKYEGLSGRWTSPDPDHGSMSVADPQSLNLYSYVHNDPVNFLDPTGLRMIWDCIRLGSGDGVVFYQCYLTFVEDVHFPQDPGPRGGGGPTGLGKNQRKFDKAKAKLLNKDLKQPSKDCAKLLAMTGLSLNEITAAVNQQVPYSGPDTTGLSMLDAGLLPPPDLSLPPPARRGAIVETSESVSAYFKAHPEMPAATAGFRSGTGNDVYYRSSGLNDTSILHETLHSATGLGDIALAKNLGLGTFASRSAASAAISNALRKNGCTKD